MKKIFISKIALLLICLVSIVLLLPENISAGQIPEERLLPRLIDGADLLTDSEEAKLLERLDEISEKYQTDVVIVTNYSLEGKTSTAYADDFFDYNGYGFGENADGILFLLSMEERDWAISTTGSGIQTFTDAGLEYIVDEFISDISDAKYAQGLNKYLDLVEKFLKQAATGKPYDVGNMPKKPLAWYFLPITLVGGMLISYMIVSGMKSKLKTVKRQAAADDYVRHESFRLNDRRDLYLYSHVSRTARPTESSSSGGGSRSGGSRTHSSSSGRSHGGSRGKF
ncbi:MAG: TPM domain-containing protein [Clostridiaceae bacterium]|jgi:uncharacterized protein|nr:TPM domain-containing protein [Bacillota bacterium]NLN51800.1 TPM domain-containing protein [Clostridiaceae bacterium]